MFYNVTNLQQTINKTMLAMGLSLTLVTQVLHDSAKLGLCHDGNLALGHSRKTRMKKNNYTDFLIALHLILISNLILILMFW